MTHYHYWFIYSLRGGEIEIEMERERERERQNIREHSTAHMWGQRQLQGSVVIFQFAEAGSPLLVLPFSTLQVSCSANFWVVFPSLPSIWPQQRWGSGWARPHPAFLIHSEDQTGAPLPTGPCYLFSCFSFPRKLVSKCLLLFKRQT